MAFNIRAGSLECHGATGRCRLPAAARFVAGAILVASSATTMAQVPPSPDAPPRPAAIATGPGFAPAAPPSHGAAQGIMTGTVRRFVINPEGEVDGLLLSDGTLVAFPPHVGVQIVTVVRPGDAVQITGLRDASNNVRARQLVNQRTGQPVVDQPPPVPPQRVPPSLRGVGLVRLSVRGEVLRVTTAPRGEPDGVLLADGTVVKLTPPVAQQFINLLQPGTVIAAQGYGTRNQYGEALQATAFGTPGNVVQLYNSIPN